MNEACRFERSLRSKPFERPKPLRRGQGVGGGNYRRASSADNVPKPRQAGPPKRSSTPARAPRKSTSSRPQSSGSCPTPGSPSQPGPSDLSQPGPSGLSQPGPSGLCQAGPSSKSEAGLSGTGQAGPSTSKGPTSKTPTKSRPTPRDSRPQSRSGSRTSCPASTGRSQTSQRSARPSSATRPTPSKGRPPSKQRRPTSAGLGPKKSPQPGPSCLRVTSRPGPKRRVQFTGVPPPGPGPSPDSRTRLKNLSDQMYKEKLKKYYEAKRLEAETSNRALYQQTQPQPQRQQSVPSSPQGPMQGPSLYPIVPDQYETPLVSLPGPRQVLLMPGDIDPNETTIIDIAGLDEGDIQEVPGIPPHAPPSLLAEGLKEAIAEHEKWRKSLPSPYIEDKEPPKRKRPPMTIPPRGKKKEKKKSQSICPDPSSKFIIGQGKSFPFEQFGNVCVDDPKNPPYQGPSYKAPDPGCQRARPFDYRNRKTTTRQLTDAEREAMQDEILSKTIRAIISEHDARTERERLERGLGEDDLMDIDAEDCGPIDGTGAAPPDIFLQTDSCDFGDENLPRSPQISPQRDQYLSNDPYADDLIYWDQNEVVSSTQQCEEIDFLTRTPPMSPKRSPARSPNLMEMCEPDEDLIGLKSPPRKRTRSPSPCSSQSEDDLIQWGLPGVGAALPFDEPCDEDIFDTICNNRPEVSPSGRLRTPPPSTSYGSSRRDYDEMMSYQSQQFSCPEEEKLIDYSPSPCGETRIVRAVVLEGDPTTAVLEDSILVRSQMGEECDQEGTDESTLSFIDFENCDDDIVDFSKPPLPPGRPNFNPGLMEGICPLPDDDDDDLDIFDLDALPDFDCSPDAFQKFDKETTRRKLFQPYSSKDRGFQLEQETCTFDDADLIDKKYEEQQADLLHLYSEPDYSPSERRNDRRTYGTELLSQCQDPIEQCQDLLGLTKPREKTPQRRMGPYMKELLETCPDEQEIIQIGDKCSPERPGKPYSFSYSRDLFTNVDWDPSMTPQQKFFPR